MHRLLLCAIIALALWPACLADGQGRIVIRPSVPEPKGGPQGQPAASPDAVAPIEPTAEEADRIAELIEQLGAERLSQRDRAMAELAGFEARALRQVRLGKDHQDDEIAARCALLEEVIQSRQAELFLAARRLSLQPSELERLLAAEDVKPLLDILRSRAQPGLVALWARVLGRLAARTQVIPTAQLCINVEGIEGYGIALAEAGRSPLLQPDQATGLAGLVAMLPPTRAVDVVDALTHCALVAGGAEGVQAALRAAAVLRGTYTARQVMESLQGDDAALRKRGNDAVGLRQAVAVCLAPGCTEAELASAGLPALAAMNPLVLSEYLALLRRSGLLSRLSNVLVQLVTAGASARALSTAGAAWADASSIETVREGFAALPGAAQLGALDALWLNPREPRVLQPFLLGLLGHSDSSLRSAAARLLRQYRAKSTVAALAKAAVGGDVISPIALESLVAMADLLRDQPTELEGLVKLLPGSDLALRGPLVDVLVASASPPAHKALLEEWRKLLPRNELMSACEVLAADPSTPAGAYAASVMSGVETRFQKVQMGARLDQGDFVLVRALMSASATDGFALLRALAADQRSSSRGIAAGALAFAGKDGDEIHDWIRRLAGETPDQDVGSLEYAVAMSAQPAAEEFRRRALQQGAASPHIQCVVLAVEAGRSGTITREELLRVLFDTPANARNALDYASGLLRGPIPEEAMRTITTTMLFSEEFQPLGDPDSALLLAESGVDVLQLLFGDDAEAAPRDAQRLLMTALLGEPARAAAMLDKVTEAEDGSNFQALLFARAWLGKAESRDRGRLLRLGMDHPTLRMFALRKGADAGNAHDLRGLMDRFSSLGGQFSEAATAGIELRVDRWRGIMVDLDGAAGPAFGLEATQRNLAVARLQRLFAPTMPVDWDTWWSARRALVERDNQTGRYHFVELP